MIRKRSWGKSNEGLGVGNIARYVMGWLLCFLVRLLLHFLNQLNKGKGEVFVVKVDYNLD